MADGFIVRKGGVAEAGEPIPAPTITLVSKTDSSITFTLTNNSVEERDITFGLTTPPTTTTITLASQATSGNQTFSNLDDDTTFIIFAQAADGIIGQLSVTTDPAPVFTAATGGTTLEYDSGGKRFKSHTFTSDGNFVVSTAGNGDRNQVDYLIIAGGGGAPDNGGGGGAGGYRTTFGTQGGLGTLDSKKTITATTFAVVIGSGGNAANGSNSSALDITSTGGGRSGQVNTNNAQSGGSGGGGARSSGGAAVPYTGGAGTANQGFAGGDTTTRAGNFPSGGGGGAGEVGANGISGSSGVGGDGLSSIIRTGSAEFRAGGGGGSSTGTQTISGGLGGGGDGGGPDATNGTENTGGGSGGSSSVTRTGGSGIVIIRYEIAPSV